MQFIAIYAWLFEVSPNKYQNTDLFYVAHENSSKHLDRGSGHCGVQEALGTDAKRAVAATVPWLSSWEDFGSELGFELD